MALGHEEQVRGHGADRERDAPQQLTQIISWIWLYLGKVELFYRLSVLGWRVLSPTKTGLTTSPHYVNKWQVGRESLQWDSWRQLTRESFSAFIDGWSINCRTITLWRHVEKFDQFSSFRGKSHVACLKKAYYSSEKAGLLESRPIVSIPSMRASADTVNSTVLLR
jgi:hypothetical protein